jgi:AcrR family transcriptional regulator
MATAATLFAERGYEHVAVIDIARAAEVSEQTIFNYFPTKRTWSWTATRGFARAWLPRRGQSGDPAQEGEHRPQSGLSLHGTAS